MIPPLPYVAGTVLLLAAVVALFVTDLALALLGVLFMAAMPALNVTLSRRIAPRVADAQQLRAKLSAITYESIDGALVVKSLGREAEETERSRASSIALCTAMTRVGRAQGSFETVLGGLPGPPGDAQRPRGERLAPGTRPVTVAEVLSMAFLFTLLAFPMVAISQVFAALPRSVVGWQGVGTVLRASGAMRVRDGRARRFRWAAGAAPGRRRLLVRRQPPVLPDVSFEAPAGRTVALVGLTGSGKSTIVALARAYIADPDQLVLDEATSAVDPATEVRLQRALDRAPQDAPRSQSPSSPPPPRPRTRS